MTLELGFTLKHAYAGARSMEVAPPQFAALGFGNEWHQANVLHQYAPQRSSAPWLMLLEEVYARR
jgi:hypothetical protein